MDKKAAPGSREFLAIVALCIGMGALSIDLLLPAFPAMREDLGLAPGSTSISAVITWFFLGLAVGQLIHGPLSDRFGRLPLLRVGMAIFVLAALASAFATTLPMLLACRFVWGIGVAAPRSLSMAVVRDVFEGERMARTMSLLMATFIVIPVFAPSLGAAVLHLTDWRAIIGIQIVAAFGLLLWTVRLPETLLPEARRSVSPRALGEAARIVLTDGRVMGYTLAISCLFGIMTSYVGSAEVLIDEVFDASDRFAVLFGLIASFLAVGSLLSARLVSRIGYEALLKTGCLYLVTMVGIFSIVVVANDGKPPLWAFVVGMGLLLPGVSVLIPSANTAAMAPLGAVAGMGSAVIGTITTAAGAVLGSLTDGAFDGTVQPYALHALVYSAIATATISVLARSGAPAEGLRPLAEAPGSVTVRD